MRARTGRTAAAAQQGSEVLPREFFLRDGAPALIWPLLPTDAGTLREGSAVCPGIRASAGSSRRSVNSMTR
jgi:hypothetical protein